MRGTTRGSYPASRPRRSKDEIPASLRRMRRAALLITMCGLLVGAARADDEALAIDVQPDGRGSLKLDVTLDASASARLLEGKATVERVNAVAQAFALDRLIAWRGVVAWTGIQPTVTDDRRL